MPFFSQAKDSNYNFIANVHLVCAHLDITSCLDIQLKDMYVCACVLFFNINSDLGFWLGGMWKCQVAMNMEKPVLSHSICNTIFKELTINEKILLIRCVVLKNEWENEGDEYYPLSYHRKHIPYSQAVTSEWNSLSQVSIIKTQAMKLILIKIWQVLYQSSEVWPWLQAKRWYWLFCRRPF